MVFHTNFTVMIHTVATWLTFSLAIWRFIMIKLNYANENYNCSRFIKIKLNLPRNC